MPNYNATALAVCEVIRQTVHNLDVQVGQLTEAALNDVNRGNLTEAFVELAQARAHLVNAHGEISGTMPSYITREAPIR